MSATEYLNLTVIGSYLVLLGQAINAAAVVVLPDETIGSARSLGLAVGMLLSAVGAFLIARGHGATSPPVQGPVSSNILVTIPMDAVNQVLKTIVGAVSPAQANQPASKPAQA